MVSVLMALNSGLSQPSALAMLGQRVGYAVEHLVHNIESVYGFMGYIQIWFMFWTEAKATYFYHMIYDLACFLIVEQECHKLHALN